MRESEEREIEKVKIGNEEKFVGQKHEVDAKFLINEDYQQTLLREFCNMPVPK